MGKQESFISRGARKTITRTKLRSAPGRSPRLPDGPLSENTREQQWALAAPTLNAWAAYFEAVGLLVKEDH